ncbi:hypothetical protein Tco_1285712 [Tanacetum coccineum]
MVPRAVLMKFGLVSINTARQVNAAHSKSTVNAARRMSYLSRTAHLTLKRPIHKNTTFKNSNINQRVNIARDKKFNTARPKAVVNDVKENSFNAVKASACWVWKPKTKVFNHYLNTPWPSITLKKFDYVDAQGQSTKRFTNQGGGLIVESSRHNNRYTVYMVFASTKASDNADLKSSHDDGSKPSSDDGKKVNEDPRKDSECNDQEKEDNEEPKKVIHALKDPSWIEAMQEELLQFKSMIGSLMYLIIFKPDIPVCSVVLVRRYHVNPKVSHLHVVKRIYSMDIKIYKHEVCPNSLGIELISWQSKKKRLSIKELGGPVDGKELLQSGGRNGFEEPRNPGARQRGRRLGTSVVRNARAACARSAGLETKHHTRIRSCSKVVELTVDEVTLAQALAALKSVKPKVKGDDIKEPNVPVSVASASIKLSVATTTTATTPTSSSGQRQRENEIDEEERIARAKEEKIDEANIAWNDIQVKVDADYQLAKRLQTEEQEQFTIEEKATLFKELLEQRRKHFAAKRAKEKRNKRPTKTQQKKTMITYLKNMEGWKDKDLKFKDFDSIKELFDRAFKRVNTFVDFRTERERVQEK